MTTKCPELIRSRTSRPSGWELPVLTSPHHTREGGREELPANNVWTDQWSGSSLFHQTSNIKHLSRSRPPPPAGWRLLLLTPDRPPQVCVSGACEELSSWCPCSWPGDWRCRRCWWGSRTAPPSPGGTQWRGPSCQVERGELTPAHDICQLSHLHCCRFINLQSR